MNVTTGTSLGHYEVQSQLTIRESMLPEQHWLEKLLLLKIAAGAYGIFASFQVIHADQDNGLYHAM